MSAEVATHLRTARDHLATVGLNQNGDYFARADDPATSPCCAIGAVMAVCGEPSIWTLRRSLLSALPKPWRYVTEFNDDPATTLADVLAVFDKAIAAEEAS